MRLIDADALKKDIMSYKTMPEIREAICEVIDNAPTVTPSLNLNNITEEDIEKFKVIFQRAHSKGLLTILEERSQGEWGKWVITEIQCPNCFEYFETDCYSTEELTKCPICGADMRKGGAE